MKSAIFKTFLLSVLVAGQVNFVYAQTASILPPAKTTFFDNNGKPLVSGKVQFYAPGGTVPKTTWQDSAETIPNTNPVVLDGSGRAIILGDGSYRQQVFDRNNNLIWDQQTSSTGTSGGGTTPTVGDGDAVGTVKPWAGFIAPSAYVFSYGQELPRASFPELFAAITSQQNVGCTSGSPTLTGLGDTSQISIGAPIESICLNSGATVSSKTISTITASSNAIVSTTTSARFFPFGNGDGSSTFNTPDLRGRVLAGRDNMGGVAASRLTTTYFGANASAIGATGGNQSTTLVTGNLPPYTPAGTNGAITVTSTSVVQVNTAGSINANAGVAPSAPQTNTSLLTSTGSPPVFTGTAQGGTSTPLSIVQPTETLNWIIKTTPDSNPNSFFGVASIGGMTGILTCGTGITCAGNNISAVSSIVTVPLPSSSTLGGVFTKTCSTSNWFNTLDATGTFGCSQPAITNISGLGTGVVTALGVNVGATGAFVVNSTLALNVRDFGAKCDGSTDDTTAINNADASAATQGRALYFPAGICLAQGLNPRRSNLEWFGDGPYLSVLKAVNPGSGFDTLAWFGERTATTQYSNIYVHDLGFNGNGTGTNAVVEVKNITLSTFRNLQIFGGGADGFRTETTGTTINTNLLRNHYLFLESYNNVGNGFHFLGEKDSEFTGLFGHNNTLAGIYWGPANLNSSALCETTENYGGSISARDNTGDGIVFDEVEKFPLSSIQSSINSGYGIRFLSSITGCTSTGSNSVNLPNVTLRNNLSGSIRAASSDGAYVFGAQFGSIWIRGDNSNVNTTAVELDGVSSVQIDSIDIQAWPGTAFRIAQGSPLGTSTQSSNVSIGSLILLNNGSASSSTNHGLTIENTSSNIMIGALRTANSQTSGSNFELNVASGVTTVWINSAIVNASGGVGNNYNILNSTTYTLASPWTAFTPSLTCGTAVFTTNSARYKTVGKNTWTEIDFTITSIGTCTHPVTFTLPKTANSSASLNGMEIVNSGNNEACQITSGSATASCFRNFNNYTVNDHVFASGVYESQ